MIIESASSGKSKKKKSVAILLNLVLLGAFGLHRFYVGKKQSGLIMLVLSIVSSGVIGVCWGMYDLFTLLFTNKFTDADGLPLR